MKYFRNNGKSRIIISCAVFFMAFITVLLQYKFCDSAIIDSEIQNTIIKDSAESKEGYSSDNCFLNVRVGFSEKVVIPDPAKTDGKVSISLCSKKSIEKICDADKWYKKNGICTWEQICLLLVLTGLSL